MPTRRDVKLPLPFRTHPSSANTPSYKGCAWRFTAIIYQPKPTPESSSMKPRKIRARHKAGSGKDANSQSDESREREWLRRMTRKAGRTTVKPENLNRRSYTLRRNEEDKNSERR